MKGINDMDMSSKEKNALFDALGYDTQETIWNTEYEGSDYDSYFYLSESARGGITPIVRGWRLRNSLSTMLSITLCTAIMMPMARN